MPCDALVTNLPHKSPSYRIGDLGGTNDHEQYLGFCPGRYGRIRAQSCPYRVFSMPRITQMSRRAGAASSLNSIWAQRTAKFTKR
jgi:hypothetical protein